MINLHAHTLLSDGCLLPSELAARYYAAGYKVLAITDHADYSNIDQVISSLRTFLQHWPKAHPLKILSGVELTHVPPQQFKPLAAYCRKNKLQIIIAHGQTPVEPVAEGSNQAALEADIDILAHPGLITLQEARLAAKRKIMLEVTTRSGHNRTNNHVVRTALKAKARLCINHDSHRPEDILTPVQTQRLAAKAGLSQARISAVYRDVAALLHSRRLI